MTVLEVIRRSTGFLHERGIDSPRLQIELLLADVLRIPRLELYLNFERELAEPELERLREQVKRRARREPLQHILGTTSFCGIEIKVGPGALVPRPETEQLAEHAWQWLEARAPDFEGRPPVVLDFGAGTGCLALALATHIPNAEVHALEISPDALALAAENARLTGLDSGIRLHAGGGFDALPDGVSFDLIVSNPPYIPTGEIASLQPEVRDHDPRAALDGGSDGLDFFRLFAAGAGETLAPRGRLMAEFGDGQDSTIEALFRAADWSLHGFHEDLSGKRRFFVASPPEK